VSAVQPVLLDVVIPVYWAWTALIVILLVVVAIEFVVADLHFRGRKRVMPSARVLGGVLLGNVLSTLAGLPIASYLNHVVPTRHAPKLANLLLFMLPCFVVSIFIEHGVCRWIWKGVVWGETLWIVTMMNASSYIILFFVLACLGGS
jgi:hypothetical protein